MKALQRQFKIMGLWVEFKMPSLKAEYEQHQKLQVDDLSDYKVERDLFPKISSCSFEKHSKFIE